MLPSCHRSVVSTVTHGPLNMANGIFSRLYRAFKTFDQAIDIILGRGFPPGNKKGFFSILYLKFSMQYN